MRSFANWYAHLFSQEGCLDDDDVSTLMNQINSYTENHDFKVAHFDDLMHLHTWIEEQHAKTLREYSNYVNRRKNGGKRELFANVTHAKWYIMNITPTKIIDGAWLRNISLLPPSQTRDILLRIYMDEKGLYDTWQQTIQENENDHIFLWKSLLKSCFKDVDINRVDSWSQHFMLACSKDDIWIPGCIQLALGSDPVRYLPEIVGYNLGYEQLSYEMLVCAYELKELGIDSSYFDIHISVDNLDCGHAYLSLRAALSLLKTPEGDDQNSIFQRILHGLHLSTIVSETEIISRFSPASLVNAMMERKMGVVHALHDTVQLSDNRNLGECMRDAVVSKDMLKVLNENGYLNSDILEETRFYSVIMSRMRNGFTPDEMDVVRGYLESKKTHQEEDVDFVQLKLRNLLFPVLHKHRFVKMRDGDPPLTMDEYFRSDEQAFWREIEKSEWKERTRNSLLHGRMKHSKMTEADRAFLLQWTENV